MECSMTDSVSKIFKEMSLGPEPVEYLDWAKDYALKTKNEFVKDVRKIVNPKKLEGQNYSLRCLRLADRLEEHRGHLVAMLVYLKYTWTDANKITSMLINELRYSSMLVQLKLTPEEKNYDDDRVYIMEDALMGWYISRMMIRASFKCDLFVKSDLLLFYCILQDICTETLVFNEFHLTKWSEHRICPSLQSSSLKNDSELYNPILYCPMIIWADADIESAVDAFCRSLCEFKAEVPWTVSHLLIEESVFKRTVKVIEFKMKSLRIGSRFDRHTQLESVDPSSVKHPTENHDLKIFQVSDSSPVNLCIGWNPKDTNQGDTYSKGNGYMPVLPFRNLEEVRLYVKELCAYQNSIAISIWTQAVASVKASSFDQFSTVWLNCHGLFHPTVPSGYHIKCGILHFPEEGLLPFDSKQEYLYDKNKYVILDDFDEAVSRSAKALNKWADLDLCHKLTILAKLDEFINSYDSTSYCKGMTTAAGEVFKRLMDNIVGGAASKAKISIGHTPLTPVIVSFDIFNRELVKFIVSVLFHGRSVILNYRHDREITYIQNIFQILNALPILPELVIGVTSIHKDFKNCKHLLLINLNSSSLSDNEYLSFTSFNQTKWLL